MPDDYDGYVFCADTIDEALSAARHGAERRSANKINGPKSQGMNLNRIKMRAMGANITHVEHFNKHYV